MRRRSAVWFAAGILCFALCLALRVKKQDPGTERMKEIAASIHEGATAFLFSEYKMSRKP